MKTCDNCGGLYAVSSDYQQGETVSIAGKLCRCPIPLNIQKLNHGESPSQLDRIEDQLVGITARARLIEGKLDKLLQPLYVGIDWANGPDLSAENRIRLHSEHKEDKQG